MEILLVEDNPGDVRLTEIVFQSAGVSAQFSVVKDGVEAMAFLRRRDPYGDATRPDLVLLDLSLPRKDGWEVLEEVVIDEDLQRIPVVILTASKEDANVLRSLSLGAKAYLVKPLGMEQLARILGRVRGYWCGVLEQAAE